MSSIERKRRGSTISLSSDGPTPKKKKQDTVPMVDLCSSDDDDDDARLPPHRTYSTKPNQRNMSALSMKATQESPASMVQCSKPIVISSDYGESDDGELAAAAEQFELLRSWVDCGIQMAITELKTGVSISAQIQQAKLLKASSSVDSSSRPTASKSSHGGPQPVRESRAEQLLDTIRADRAIASPRQQWEKHSSQPRHPGSGWSGSQGSSSQVPSPVPQNHRVPPVSASHSVPGVPRREPIGLPRDSFANYSTTWRSDRHGESSQRASVSSTLFPPNGKLQKSADILHTSNLPSLPSARSTSSKQAPKRASQQAISRSHTSNGHGESVRNALADHAQPRHAGIPQSSAIMLPAGQYLSFLSFAQKYAVLQMSHISTNMKYMDAWRSWLAQLGLDHLPYRDAYNHDHAHRGSSEDQRKAERAWSREPAEKRRLIERAAILLKHKTSIDVHCIPLREPQSVIPGLTSKSFHEIERTYFYETTPSFPDYATFLEQRKRWLSDIGFYGALSLPEPRSLTQTVEFDRLYAQLHVLQRQSIEAHCRQQKMAAMPCSPTWGELELKYAVYPASCFVYNCDYVAKRSEWLQALELNFWPFSYTNPTHEYNEVAEVAWSEMTSTRRSVVESHARIMKERLLPYAKTWSAVEGIFGFSLKSDFNNDEAKYNIKRTAWLNTIGMGGSGGESLQERWLTYSDLRKATVLGIARAEKEMYCRDRLAEQARLVNPVAATQASPQRDDKAPFQTPNEATIGSLSKLPTACKDGVEISATKDRDARHEIGFHKPVEALRQAVALGEETEKEAEHVIKMKRSTAIISGRDSDTRPEVKEQVAAGDKVEPTEKALPDRVKESRRQPRERLGLAVAELNSKAGNATNKPAKNSVIRTTPSSSASLRIGPGVRGQDAIDPGETTEPRKSFSVVREAPAVMSRRQSMSGSQDDSKDAGKIQNTAVQTLAPEASIVKTRIGIRSSQRSTADVLCRRSTRNTTRGPANISNVHSRRTTTKAEPHEQDVDTEDTIVVSSIIGANTPEPAETPKKRGRGRPRTGPVALHSSVQVGALQPAEIPTKRGRGRPRKQPVILNSSVEVDTADLTKAKKKKGRGQPRKAKREE